MSVHSHGGYSSSGPSFGSLLPCWRKRRRVRLGPPHCVDLLPCALNTTSSTRLQQVHARRGSRVHHAGRVAIVCPSTRQGREQHGGIQNRKVARRRSLSAAAASVHTHPASWSPSWQLRAERPWPRSMRSCAGSGPRQLQPAASRHKAPPVRRTPWHGRPHCPGARILAPSRVRVFVRRRGLPLMTWQ